MSILESIFTKFGLETDAASFARGELAAKGIEKALELVAEAARFVTEQLKEATFGVFEQADALGKLAQRTGVGVQELQALQYGASLADVSMESLSSGLKHLSMNMVAAVNGNKDLKDSFYGLPLTDATGHLRATEDVLADLADMFEKMPEGAGKTALQIKLLGKSGADLAPMWKGGSASFEQFTTEFKKLHGGFSQDFIDGSEKFHDNLTRIKTAWSGIQAQVAEAVLPALNDIVDSSLEWVKANQELIKTKVKEWVEDAVATVRYWVKSIEEWIAKQGGLGAVIQKTIEYVKYFGIALAALKIVEVVTSVGKLIGVLKELGALTLTGLGFFALAAEMVYVGKLIYDNWDDIRGLGMEIRYVFEDIGSAIMSAFGAAIDWVAGKIEWVVKKYHEAREGLGLEVNDTSTSGTRGVTQNNAVIDQAVAMGHQISAGTLGLTAPTLVERGSGASVSIVSSPNITVVQQPGQDSKQLAAFVVQHIEADKQKSLREAQGGIQ